MKALGALTIAVLAFGLGGVVWADGGLLRAHQPAGPFIISIFTAPEPLRVGPVEVSVLVQSSGGAALTGAVVDVLLESATAPSERRRARATSAAASNSLTHSAIVDLPAAGQWMLAVSVSFGGDATTVRTLLPVAPAPSPISRIWPWLLVPPVVIALFGAHQTLKQRCLQVGATETSMAPGMPEGLRKAGTQAAGVTIGRERSGRQPSSAQ